MKVSEVRDALSARGLDATGLKAELKERLEAAMSAEQAEQPPAAATMHDAPADADAQSEKPPAKRARGATPRSSAPRGSTPRGSTQRGSTPRAPFRAPRPTAEQQGARELRSRR